MNHLETIGLGLAITKLQFVAQVKRHQYSYGFKTVIHIRFKRTCTDEQKKCIEVWLQSHDLSMINRTQIGGEDMWRILDLLEPYHSLMGKMDVINIKKMHWLKDNPIPKVLYKDDGTRRSRKIGKNWKKFLHWAEAWDAYDDFLKSI